MNQIVLRPGRPEDSDAILAIDADARREPGRVRMIERILAEGACIVAEGAQGLVAYGALEHTFFDRGFVPILYVAEAHRRQGVGAAVLRALERRCATDRIFTSTNRSNTPMRALLASLGYEPSGEVTHLDPGDPELFFSRALT